MFTGTPLLEKTVQDFIKMDNNHPRLNDFAYVAAQGNLDALGNPVDKQESSPPGSSR
jgi:hypothetical protein